MMKQLLNVVCTWGSLEMNSMNGECIVKSIEHYITVDNQFPKLFLVKWFSEIVYTSSYALSCGFSL